MMTVTLGCDARAAMRPRDKARSMYCEAREARDGTFQYVWGQIEDRYGLPPSTPVAGMGAYRIARAWARRRGMPPPPTFGMRA